MRHHVFSATSTGLVYETYWGNGNSLTTSQLANDGSAVAGISSLKTPDNVEHVYTGSADGNVHETYWGNGNSLTTWTLAALGVAVVGVRGKVS